MSQKSSHQRLRKSRSQRRRQARTRLIVGVSIGAVLLVGGLILLSVLSAPESALDSEGLSGYEGFEQTVERSGAIGFAIGDPAAPVTVVEYSDFSCPHCADLANTMHQLIDEYVRDGRVKLIFKPITFVYPAYSTPAAQSAICAGEQGKFWEMHDQIWTIFYANGPGGYIPRLLSPRAESIGLNMSQYDACLSSAQTQADIDGVLDEAGQMGITGTPAIYVNGEQLGFTGAETFYGQLIQLIESKLGG
jgi:protein-disulfide isomerase